MTDPFEDPYHPARAAYGPAEDAAAGHEPQPETAEPTEIPEPTEIAEPAETTEPIPVIPPSGWVTHAPQPDPGEQLASNGQPVGQPIGQPAANGQPVGPSVPFGQPGPVGPLIVALGEDPWSEPTGEPVSIVPWWPESPPPPETTWTSAAHWLPLLTSWVGPLVVWLTVGSRDPRVGAAARESLNFEITFLLALASSALLVWLGVGLIGVVVLPVAWLVLRVRATLRASDGHEVRYPLTLRPLR